MRKFCTSFIFICLPGLIFAQSFSLVTNEAGLSSATHTNGVAVADYDLDGNLDIYFVAHQQYDVNDPTTWNRLFRNNGDGTFSDVTAQAGVISRLSGQRGSPMGFKFGAAWGDYDNDGDPDLYLTNFGPNELFQNQGDGTFREVAQQAGVQGNSTDIHSSAVWWDYDRDGDLDLYVSAWGGASTDYHFTTNIMYENLGDGTFQDVTQATALGDTGRTWTALPIDANNDGWLDLYVINDFGANRFYLNLGNKTFREETRAFALEDSGNGMGVTVGDYDNNGFFDIYLTNIGDLVPPTPNALFHNTGEGYFLNRSTQLGVDNAGWAWGTEFFDCDNDGDLDLYVVNGFKLEPGRNFFFLNLLNQGNLTFLNRSQETRTDGEAEARGLVVFDYDNDGDLDMAVANFKAPAYLYKNVGQNQNWLKIKLIGTQSNRDAFGAIVRVTADGKTYHRYNDGVEFLGQSIQPVHVGLGQAQRVEEIRVEWPSGLVETVHDLAVNQTVVIKEGVGLVTSVEVASQKSIPDHFRLFGNYPNPFNGSTLIQFEIPRGGEVELLIANLLGQTIRKVTKYYSTAGKYQITWDGKDLTGKAVSSGMYFYQLRFGNREAKGRMVYLK